MIMMMMMGILGMMMETPYDRDSRCMGEAYAATPLQETLVWCVCVYTYVCSFRWRVGICDQSLPNP